MPDNVDLEDAVKTIIPICGALMRVRAVYKTNVGARALVNVTRQGNPIPFGATANLIVGEKITSSSFVGVKGDFYHSGVPEKSQILVQWG